MFYIITFLFVCNKHIMWSGLDDGVLSVTRDLVVSYIRLLMGMQMRVMIKVTLMMIILIRVMVTMLEMMIVCVNINLLPYLRVFYRRG